MNNIYNICVVTGTRAEYGLLRNVIKLFSADKQIDLHLAVTGTHLSDEFGYTINEIIADGFSVEKRISCVESTGGDYGVLKSMTKALDGFREYFHSYRPDMLVLLGDRYEIFACATIAAVYKIPIAHLYGGDTTEGAIDEFFRHSITKMSYLHFVSNENSRRRVIQLGEQPSRVFNVGATGAENVFNMKLLPKKTLEDQLAFKLDKPYAVVTFHPVTMEESTAESQSLQLLEAIESFDDMKFVFTKANADADGMRINQKIDQFVAKHDNCIAFDSLGTLRYLSALNYAEMAIGNSSSGIYEVPLFGIPTVNIGDRQKGRLQGKTVINCLPEKDKIVMAVEAARGKHFSEMSSPYYKADTSTNIVITIKNVLEKNQIDLKKQFYDMEKQNV